MSTSMKKGINAVIEAKGGEELQKRVAGQVHARLDGAKMAGLTIVKPAHQAPKGHTL